MGAATRIDWTAMHGARDPGTPGPASDAGAAIAGEQAAGEQATTEARPGPPTRRAPSDLFIGLAAAAVVVVATVVAYLVGASGEERFAAEADLLLEVGGDVGADQAALLLETQVVVIEGPEVLQQVSEESGIPYEDLATDIDAGVVLDSQVVRVQATRADADEAAELAAMVTAAYLDRVAAPAGDDALATYLQEQLDEVTERQIEVRAEIDELSAGAQPDTAQQRVLYDELGQLNSRQGLLQERLLARQLEAVDGADVRVLGDVRALDDPVEPRPLRTAALGALAGGLVAGALVLWLLQRRNARWGP